MADVNCWGNRFAPGLCPAGPWPSLVAASSREGGRIWFMGCEDNLLSPGNRKFMTCVKGQRSRNTRTGCQYVPISLRCLGNQKFPELKVSRGWFRGNMRGFAWSGALPRPGLSTAWQHIGKDSVELHNYLYWQGLRLEWLHTQFLCLLRTLNIIRSVMQAHWHRP